MKNSYTLYGDGSVNSTDIMVHSGKVCIRQNSSGGEHLTYVTRTSETALFVLLQSQSHRWDEFARNSAGNNGRRSGILMLLAEKFTNIKKDPYIDIQQFFKDNAIKYTSTYWPDSDRF
ncbi:hypothetical protein ACFSQJ_01230 [Croceitalea marina]|uniref:Uncharacterized protein n=1 Tax=Croceitalea marina TaxID=1775166 RepID=A0ABW5MSS5_9FLAO